MPTQEEKDRAEFEALLAESERGTASRSSPAKARLPEAGETVRGRILDLTADAVFVDLGGKTEGILDRIEILDAEGRPTVEVGEELTAIVAGIDPESGAVRLRRRIARGPEVAREIRQAFELGLPVEGRIQSVVKGGLEVDVAGLRAFCPASQVDTRYVADLAEFVGRRETFRITRLEEKGRTVHLVLSRRVLLEAEAKERAEAARAKLAPGTVVHGTVRSLTGYGAFVDLGGVEGMLHVSEIGHARLAHPQEILAVGQSIEVQVLKIEPGEKGDRISLSMKALAADPWKDAARRFPEGLVVPGRVRRLETFGAFVEIAPGLEGLLHVSELGAERRVLHPREVLALGADVRVRVLGVDAARRRISLGIARDEDPRDEPSQEPVGPAAFGLLADKLRNFKR